MNFGTQKLPLETSLTENGPHHVKERGRKWFGGIFHENLRKFEFRPFFDHTKNFGPPKVQQKTRFGKNSYRHVKERGRKWFGGIFHENLRKFEFRPFFDH